MQRRQRTDLGPIEAKSGRHGGRRQPIDVQLALAWCQRDKSRYPQPWSQINGHDDDKAAT